MDHDLTGQDRIQPVRLGRRHADGRSRHPAAASWSLERLANCWNAKHASAMYVSADARETQQGDAEYRFGDEVLIGEGTDVFRLLRDPSWTSLVRSGGQHLCRRADESPTAIADRGAQPGDDHEYVIQPVPDSEPLTARRAVRQV